MYEVSKRKIESENAETKRARALLDSDEADNWPVYVHPQGGTVKFSPWDPFGNGSTQLQGRQGASLKTPHS